MPNTFESKQTNADANQAKTSTGAVLSKIKAPAVQTIDQSNEEEDDSSCCVDLCLDGTNYFVDMSLLGFYAGSAISCLPLCIPVSEIVAHKNKSLARFLGGVGAVTALPGAAAGALTMGFLGGVTSCCAAPTNLPKSLNQTVENIQEFISKHTSFCC